MMRKQRKKILIVDDEYAILGLLKTILEDVKYTVMTTARGDDVEKLCKADPPDLILLDVLLSGMDGREIAKGLKSRDATKRIPIILLSAHPSAGQNLQLCGADAFLAKPFDLDDLLDRIAAHV
jgi:DNA-binding response OmpR family regulator